MHSLTLWFTRRPWLTLLFIILLGLAKVIYLSVNMPQRSDEDAHVTTGLEWWLYGSYTYERLHPPLARLFAALPTYLAGKHNQPDTAPHPCSKTFLEHYETIKRHHQGGGFASPCLNDSQYHQLYEPEEMKPWVKYSRISTHLFYALSILGMFLLARKMFSTLVGLMAAFVFSLHFTLIEFGAFVMTDVPMIAFMLLALWAWIRWLEHPGTGRMVVFSFLVTAAILTKYSVLYYMPVFMFGMIAIYGFQWRRFWHLILGGVIILLLSWSIFGFSLHRPDTVIPPLSSEWAKDIVPEPVRSTRWMPLGEMVQGIFEVIQKNKKGHRNPDYHGHDPENQPGRDLYYLFGFMLRSPLLALLPVVLLIPLLAFKPSFAHETRSGRNKQITCFLLLLLTFLMLLNSNIFLAMHHAIPVFLFSTLIAASMLVRLSQVSRLFCYGIALWMIGAYSYFWFEYKPFTLIETPQDKLYRLSYESS